MTYSMRGRSRVYPRIFHIGLVRGMPHAFCRNEVAPTVHMYGIQHRFGTRRALHRGGGNARSTSWKQSFRRLIATPLSDVKDFKHVSYTFDLICDCHVDGHRREVFSGRCGYRSLCLSLPARDVGGDKSHSRHSKAGCLKPHSRLDYTASCSAGLSKFNRSSSLNQTGDAKLRTSEFKWF